MHKQPYKQTGFSTIEVLIVLIVILLAGAVGYYAWHASRSVDKSVTVSPVKYLVIKNWGVQIPYTSADTFSSKPNSENQVVVGSKLLGDKYDPLCAERGAGVISRVRGTDTLSNQERAEYSNGNYQTYNDLYAQKLGIFASATKVNGYIYYFLHSADYCFETQIIGNNSKNTHDVAARADIDATNIFVKSILPHIEPISP